MTPPKLNARSGFFMRSDLPARSLARRRRLHSLMLRGSQKRTSTQRIRITRSIFLAGEHAEKGSIHVVKKPLADVLIAQGSALPLRTGWWFVLAAACLVLGVGVVVWWFWPRW